MNSIAASAIGFAIGVATLLFTRNIRRRSKLAYWTFGVVIFVASALIASRLVKSDAEAESAGHYLFYFWVAYMVYAIIRHYMKPLPKKTNEDSRTDT
jgi:predicted tellurium resistance membrane protein TerC